MEYLTEADVEQLNAFFVGCGRLLSPQALGSSIARPQQTVGGEDAWVTIHDKAAALFCSLVRNHAFLEANKRTAVLAVRTFYARNGWALYTPNEMDLAHLASDVVLDAADEAKVASLFEFWTFELTDEDLP